MDKATLQQYLAQADDHIDGARRRIERQTRLAAQLRVDGHDTRMAEQLLQQFEDTLRTLQTDRDLIADLLRRAAK